LGAGLFEAVASTAIQLNVNGGAAGLVGGGVVGGTLTIAPAAPVPCEVQRLDEGLLRVRFPGQRLRGLEAIDVDLRTTDPSYARAALASALYRARNLVAPRVGLARVSGNVVAAAAPGLIVEVFDERLLRRTFPSTAHLYGSAGDLTFAAAGSLDVLFGDETATGNLDAVVAAIAPTLTGPGFLAQTADVLRQNAIVRFLAVEGWLGHADGYGRARSDFLLHIDDAGEARLLPGDLDGMSLTGDVIPVGSALHTACSNDPPCTALLQEELSLTSAAVTDADLDGLLDDLKGALTGLPGVDPEAVESVRAALGARAAAVDAAVDAP
jgi:hypothetical protein